MLIIFGVKTGTRLLGVVTVSCRRCGNPAAHRLEERRRVLTLFFVPLVPLGRKNIITCAYCGLVSNVERDQVPTLMAQAHDVILRGTPQRSRGDVLPEGRQTDRP